MASPLCNMGNKEFFPAVLRQPGKSEQDEDVKRLTAELRGIDMSRPEDESKIRKLAVVAAKEAKRKASNLLHSDYVRRAIQGSIVVPELV